MARRYSRIERGAEYQQAQENLADWMRQKANNPTSKLAQGGVVENSRPRRECAVRPFNRDVGNGGYALTQVTIQSYDKLGQTLSSRISVSDTNIIAAQDLDRFKPAKVHYFEPEKTNDENARYARSERTGLYYVKREGTSYTVPFGATSDNEELKAGSNEVKRLVYNVAATIQYRRVHISPEK